MQLNQEEADTKLLLHAKHVLDSDDRKLVLVRSPSGDTDIQVLLISTFLEESEQKRIYIDSGSGKSRKILHLDSVDMNSDLKLHISKVKKAVLKSFLEKQ